LPSPVVVSGPEKSCERVGEEECCSRESRLRGGAKPFCIRRGEGCLVGVATPGGLEEGLEGIRELSRCFRFVGESGGKPLVLLRFMLGENSWCGGSVGDSGGTSEAELEELLCPVREGLNGSHFRSGRNLVELME